jgi:uncharacterized protein YbjT (DUF2867 family)
MRTLIFGASGYVGRHVTSHLASAGDEVRGVARTSDAARVIAHHGAIAIKGDLGDEQFLAGALAWADRVIWAAQLMLADERAFI